MSVAMAIRWWPPLGVLAMLGLGLVVGTGPTRIDDGFTRLARGVVGSHRGWLLVFTDWWLLGPALAACVAAGVYRRQWRLAVVTVVCPLATIGIVEALKRLFERHKCGTLGCSLAYPSGHMALAVVVMGMVVLVAGARLWAVAVAVVVSLLAMCGLASTFHYFTDTIGAALLATAMVCVAARLAGCVAAGRGSPAADAKKPEGG